MKNFNDIKVCVGWVVDTKKMRKWWERFCGCQYGCECSHNNIESIQWNSDILKRKIDDDNWCFVTGSTKTDEHRDKMVTVLCLKNHISVGNKVSFTSYSDVANTISSISEQSMSNIKSIVTELGSDEDMKIIAISSVPNYNYTPNSAIKKQMLELTQRM